ncbi:hypothetical protein HIM_05958 [Hirsutella minnesotensis 3608]|uniref:Uncharacterized protein n=1 Tax=Hirsutella minnesotensis 3608 TaxID=1043627 RepID=A0A0F7ZUC2_9HYPO|nr:hypothetical protein HIM_05958 [Hirsutella minnesotensis 3608]
MPRLIDQFPEPAQPRRMKVVVASASRTGTLGLYHALKMLGYKPYHMIEALQNGSTHVNVFNEALRAEYNRFSGIKRYTKADFDKWFAGRQVHLHRARPGQVGGVRQQHGRHDRLGWPQLPHARAQILPLRSLFLPPPRRYRLRRHRRRNSPRGAGQPGSPPGGKLVLIR